MPPWLVKWECQSTGTIPLIGCVFSEPFTNHFLVASNCKTRFVGHVQKNLSPSSRSSRKNTTQQKRRTRSSEALEAAKLLWMWVSWCPFQKIKAEMYSIMFFLNRFTLVSQRAVDFMHLFHFWILSFLSVLRLNIRSFAVHQPGNIYFHKS